MKANIIANADVVNSNTISYKDKKLQWSVNSSVGLQFNITRFLGLFAEPGISYHFDSGTSVKTIYNEKPSDFRLLFGIRASF